MTEKKGSEERSSVSINVNENKDGGQVAGRIDNTDNSTHNTDSSTKTNSGQVLIVAMLIVGAIALGALGIRLYSAVFHTDSLDAPKDRPKLEQPADSPDGTVKAEPQS